VFDVVVYPQNASSESDGIEFTGVDKVSFVSSETYGRPPLLPGVSSASDIGPSVGKDEMVLYVATSGVAAVQITRSSTP
jgi:hypothetical protein